MEKKKRGEKRMKVKKKPKYKENMQPTVWGKTKRRHQWRKKVKKKGWVVAGAL